MADVHGLVKGIKGLTPGEVIELAEAMGQEFDELDAEPATLPVVREQHALVASSEVVLRSGGVRAMAARKGRAVDSPERSRAGRSVLVAAAGMHGIAPGEAIADRYELAEHMAATLTRMDRSAPPRGRVLLASASWSYPEHRQLTDDADRNWRIVDRICHPMALVASGGICQPVNVDYAVPTWATAERPLRDGLPGFQATRGGLRYVTPPTVGDLAAATTVWTEATDADPGDATKPVLQVVCGTEETVLLDAVPTRLQFGNMQSRFAPEQVAANTDLAIAAAARIAENNLLGLIAAQCVADVTSAVVLGATRDLLTVVGQAAAGLRSLHRISSTMMLTAVLPAWARELLRVDLAREIGHAQTDSWNSLALTDDQVDELLRARGVNPIWHLDGQAADGEVYPNQYFGTQSASSAVNPFPAKLVWYLFPEGAIQFLDGGRLDLGVVRDSVLDSTNDYETFVETFESIAFRGFTGAAIQYVTDVCATGLSAGTSDTTGDCA